MKNPIVKRKLAGSIIKTAAKKQAAKKRHEAWLKNKKPTVRGFNPNKPWVINQAGKATNKIPAGTKGRKPMGDKNRDLGPVIPKPSVESQRIDKAWMDKLAKDLKKKPKVVKKTTPPPQLPAVQGSRAAVKPPQLPVVQGSRAAVRSPAKTSASIPPLSLKGNRQKITGWKDLTKTQKAAIIAAGGGAAAWGAGKIFGGDVKKIPSGPKPPSPAKPPAPPKKPASKIKDPKAIAAVDRMIEDRGRDALRVARQDPETGDAKAAEKVAKSMKGKDPDWMDKFLGSMGIKKIKGPKDWGAGKRTYQVGGKGGKTFDIDSTPYEETLEPWEREMLEASYKKGGKIGKKKGGKVGKKKQGYKARKDESIAMRVKKKRTKKQLKASRDESYGKKGKGKINRNSGSALVASLYD
jgi:hypothetical protein